MKIAVTYENGQIFQHFGHCENFKIYEVQDGRIISSEILGSDGQGHGALATLLGTNNVDVLICGGIGGGAKMALAEASIELYPGVSGDADQAVEAYLSGNLIFDPETSCNHHHEGEEGHNCAHGHCGK